MQRLPWTPIGLMRQLFPGFTRNAVSRAVCSMAARQVDWSFVALLVGFGWLGVLVLSPPATAINEIRWQWSGESKMHVVETIPPGRVHYLPGAAYITIFAHEPWDLDVSTAFFAEGGGPVATTLTPMLVPHGEAQLNGTSKRSGTTGLAAETGRLKDQPPTGAQGQTFQVDLLVDASWDDPPGKPLHAQLYATVSPGAMMSASYVSPPRWPVGYEGPIELWASFSSPAGGAGEIPDNVWLTVRSEATGHIVLSMPVEVNVNEFGWQRVVLPPQFAPGDYAYRLEVSNPEVDNPPREVTEGTTIAMGTFSVMAPTVLAMGEGIQDARDKLKVTDQASPTASLYRPEARLQVDGAQVAPGQSGQWLVRVFNPGIFALLGARLYVCLPRGWYLTEANDPRMSARRDGQDCPVLLLGNVPGRSQRQVEFSIIQWPPWGTNPFRLDTAQTVDFHLFVNVPGEDEPRLLRTVKAPLASSGMDLLGESRVTGWVFRDVDQNGQRGEGEPGVGGVDIFVNGRFHRKSNRNGSFTLHLPRGTHTLWAAGEEGRTRAVIVHVGTEDVADVALPFESLDPEEYTTRYEYYLSSVLIGDGSGVDAHHNLNGSFTGRWGQLAWNSSGMGTDGRLRMPGTDYDLEAEWRSGIPQRVRMGALRPSMPVQSAWKLGIYGSPRLWPRNLSVLVSPQIEMGGAFDDYWQCRIVRAGVNWSVGSTRYKTDVGQAFHSRTDEVGLRTETIGYISLEGTGDVPSIGNGIGDGWRYSFGAYHGRRRQLSPSCGQSPRDGVHFSLGLHPRTSENERLIERVAVATSRWPQGGRAMELSVQTIHIPVLSTKVEGSSEIIRPTVRITPAIQWGRERSALDAKAWLRPGLSLESQFGDHRVDVQLGYRPLGEVRRELDVERGEDRRYVRWRWQPGRIGLTAALETNGRDASLRRGSEVGFSLRDPLRPGALPGLTSSRLELRRSHSATRLRDELRIDATLAGQRARLRLSGRRPRSPGDPFILSFTTYETLRASFSVGGVLPFGHRKDVSWQLSTEMNGSPTELSRRVSLGLKSPWKRGMWGVEFGQNHRYRTMGRSVDNFLHAQATCRCRQWNLEAGISHVLRKSVPEGSSAAHDLTALRLHAGRSLTPSLSGFVELALSQMDDLDGWMGPNTPLFLVGSGSNSWLAVGLEWMTTVGDNPIIFGLGLRYPPSDLLGGWQPGSEQMGWFVHVRTPIYSDGLGTDN